MKYVKMLGLLAVAAAALMAFAGSASATLLTSPTGTPYTGEINAETELGHAVLHNTSLGSTVECASKVSGTVSSHGTGVTAKGNISSLLFEPCTNSWHVTTIVPGSLELHYVSSGTALLTSSQATVQTTRFGIVCNYVTNNTVIGHLTDSHKTGGHATLDINAAIPIHSGSSGFCGSGDAHWTGNYTITGPNRLYVDH